MYRRLKYIAVNCICVFQMYSVCDKKEGSEIFEPLSIFSDVFLAINYSLSICATPLQTFFLGL